MRTGRRLCGFAIALCLATADAARALTYVNLLDEPSPRAVAAPVAAVRAPVAEELPEPGAAPPAETLPEPGAAPERPPPPPPRPTPPPVVVAPRGTPVAAEEDDRFAAARARLHRREAGAGQDEDADSAPKPKGSGVRGPGSGAEQDEDSAPKPKPKPRPKARPRDAEEGAEPRGAREGASAPVREAVPVAARRPRDVAAPGAKQPAARRLASGATRGVPRPRATPAPPPPPPRMAWASVGTYLMSYSSDLQSPDVTVRTPGGGGNIENLEVGLGGPWSAGYSRIGVLGDLPGSQSDLHVNFALPDGWLVQVGASMGELAANRGGPIGTDFNGTEYSLIKAFRISDQWRFQASYTNVPVRDYTEFINRPTKSRVGYHLFTVSYSPVKANRDKISIDAGILRLNDIRPIGFNYLYAGVSYRFRVPAILK